MFLLLAAMSAPPWQRTLKENDIPPPDPKIERASFILSEGFEVNLSAADPLLAKPIQMNFDPAGRLWIASSEIYPQILPGQTANDKIIVLEDIDGDGRADKTSVFAEGLLIPTGVEPGDGGAYVANSTELIHLRDTDGDGRADTRRIVLSGFGTEDTHHILHTFRWGHDGMLYFNQSVYIHSHIETPYGVRRLAGGGIWQSARDACGWRSSCAAGSNTGDITSIAGVGPCHRRCRRRRNQLCLPRRGTRRRAGRIAHLHGLNPGSPKYCGLEITCGRHLPDDWQGNAITHDFRANRVCRFVLSEDRSGYAAREQVEVIKTSHVAFRPIDVKMGPDGAIYMADWYNPIIQHGEVDFRDPRRDHTHGRIWRITAKGRPLAPRPKLVGASNAELFEALKVPEAWTCASRPSASSRNVAPEILTDLDAWVQALPASDPDVEHHRLEAL